MGNRTEVIKLYITRVKDVVSVTDNHQEFTTSVNFSEGEKWEQVKLTIGSMEFSEEQDRSMDMGPFYKQTFSGSLPSKNRKGLSYIHSLTSEPVIVKMELADGSRVIAGNRKIPVKFRSDFKRKGNEIILKFDRESPYFAYSEAEL